MLGSLQHCMGPGLPVKWGVRLSSLFKGQEPADNSWTGQRAAAVRVSVNTHGTLDILALPQFLPLPGTFLGTPQAPGRTRAEAIHSG